MMLRSAYTVTTPSWPQPAEFSSTDVLRRPPGYLYLEQRAQLTAVAERLQMAHDLSQAVAAGYPALPADATATHALEIAAVRRLLGRYGLADPNAGHRPGRFTGRRTQTEYDQLVAHAGTGPDAAVAATAEALRQLLAEVNAPSQRVHAPDVRVAYRQLSTAAGRRLRALRAWNRQPQARPATLAASSGGWLPVRPGVRRAGAPAAG